MKSTTMPWIDYLPEVGDTILKRRDAIAAQAETAIRLEQGIIGLRKRIARAKADLLASVRRNWSLQDMELASSRADAAGERLLHLADPILRATLHDMPAECTAVDAILAFEHAVARALRNTDDQVAFERALEAVKTWWLHVGEPVAQRVRLHEASLDVNGEQQ